ncbi:MAG: hypothetical protein WA133_13155 [Syntrophales bacterium]
MESAECGMRNKESPRIQWRDTDAAIAVADFVDRDTDHVNLLLSLKRSLMDKFGMADISYAHHRIDIGGG